jgi:hypothetical protein
MLEFWGLTARSSQLNPSHPLANTQSKEQDWIGTTFLLITLVTQTRAFRSRPYGLLILAEVVRYAGGCSMLYGRQSRSGRRGPRSFARWQWKRGQLLA